MQRGSFLGGSFEARILFRRIFCSEDVFRRISSIEDPRPELSSSVYFFFSTFSNHCRFKLREPFFYKICCNAVIKRVDFASNELCLEL